MKEHYMNYMNGAYVIPKEGRMKEVENRQQTQLSTSSKCTATNPKTMQRENKTIMKEEDNMKEHYMNHMNGAYVIPEGRKEERMRKH